MTSISSYGSRGRSRRSRSSATRKFKYIRTVVVVLMFCITIRHLSHYNATPLQTPLDRASDLTMERGKHIRIITRPDPQQGSLTSGTAIPDYLSKQSTKPYGTHSSMLNAKSNHFSERTSGIIGIAPIPPEVKGSSVSIAYNPPDATLSESISHGSIENTRSNDFSGQVSDNMALDLTQGTVVNVGSDNLSQHLSDNVSPGIMRDSMEKSLHEEVSKNLSSNVMHSPMENTLLNQASGASFHEEVSENLSSNVMHSSLENTLLNQVSGESLHEEISENLSSNIMHGSMENSLLNQVSESSPPDDTKDSMSNTMSSENLHEQVSEHSYSNTMHASMGNISSENSTGEESNTILDAVKDSGTSNFTSSNALPTSSQTSSSTSDPPTKNPRKFVSYTSSSWEKMWLDNIDEWQKNESICDVLLSPEHTKFMYDFLKSTCTNDFKAPYSNWCMIDDEMHPLYFNTENHDKIEYHWEASAYPGLFWTGPEDVSLISDDQPTRVIDPTPDMEHVFSKFVFLDETTGEEYTEYIEPLVSHLRFPLSKCEEDKTSKWHDILYSRGLEYRGYVIPPVGVRNKRKLYFDAGASNWSKVSKGSSLQYFYHMWKRQGIEWDHIYAYEMMTTPDDFFNTVPEEHKDLVTYQQCAVSSAPEEDSGDHPFLPYEIRRKANADDYVLFKLDIDSYGIEVGTIEHIINDPTSFVDEVVFEHHVSGNYLMRPEWGNIEGGGGDVSLLDSYNLFLRMRMKGIRSHSWI